MRVVMRGVILYFLLIYDYDYIRGRNYDLIYDIIMNERHFKRDSSLAPSELE